MDPHLNGDDIYYLSSKPDIGAILIESGRALKVAEIVQDGPAHKAGLQKDDIITHINDRPYNARAGKDYKNNISSLLYNRSPVKLNISRGSLVYEVEVSKKTFTGLTSYPAAEEFNPLPASTKPELTDTGRLEFGSFGTYVVTADETPWYEWDEVNKALGEQIGTLPKGACLKYTSNARNPLDDHAKLMIDEPGGSIRWEPGMVKMDDIAMGAISRSNCTADMDSIRRPVNHVTIEEINASVAARTQAKAPHVKTSNTPAAVTDSGADITGKFLVTASALHIRQSPSENSQSLGTFLQGSCVTVTADAAGDFVKVSTIDMDSKQVYISGYVSNDYLAARDKPESYACRAEFTPS